MTYTITCPICGTPLDVTFDRYTLGQRVLTPQGPGTVVAVRDDGWFDVRRDIGTTTGYSERELRDADAT